MLISHCHPLSPPLVPGWVTGHYVPAIAAYIHNQNERLATGGAPPSNVEHQLVVPETALPLAGIAVGDGWVDPVNMLQVSKILPYFASTYRTAICLKNVRTTLDDECGRDVTQARVSPISCTL